MNESERGRGESVMRGDKMLLTPHGHTMMCACSLGQMNATRYASHAIW